MLALAAVTLATAALPTFDDAVQTGLKDIAFSVKVVSAKRAELRKINRDFAISYEAKEVKVQWKEPMKLRLTSKVNGQALTYLVVGSKKTYHIPRLRLKKTEDISKSPGKRQTLLDFGMISPSMSKSFLKGSYVRTDREGRLIFDVNYQYAGDTSRHRVWIDAGKRYVVKRMWFNRKGQLMATFDYTEPVEANGLWIPTKLTVRNAEGKVAGVSRFESIKVNGGIPDSVFKL
ncbi:MAG: outer membrane lipoprotein-sorting protein [Armatimonadetes bacterium]|nr:outer membrane lipoprotein-sorting protein [Armatimonadota bacterium]